MNEKIIYEYNIPDYKQDTSYDDLYSARSIVSKTSGIINPFDSEVTILVQAYNRIEKTKECIENLLKYTTGVNYDLLLIDNGSTDDTFEYFKSIPYDKVQIIHITNNITAAFSWNFIELKMISDYLVILANDIIVTPNWLSNLLTAAKSDPRIGMVNPISSNVSNLQELSFEFSSIEDMQKKANKLNITDPTKWHERLRLITLGSLFKKECLYAIGLPVADLGFFHDFADDDITFKIRRHGYKAILAKDTWIHHNHDFRNMEDKDPAEFQRSLDMGRKNFQDKYYGVDAWEDVNNYIPEIIPKIKIPYDKSNCSILGVDVKCGTPILEIKNHIRSFGAFDATCCAITSEGKYFIDLQTVCGTDNVFACSPENAFGYLPQDYFDYIIIGNGVNEYPEPYKVIKSVYSLLKKGGQMFIYLKNTFDIYAFLNVIGYKQVLPPTNAYNISIDSFVNVLKGMDICPNIVGTVPYNNIPNEYINEVNKRTGLFVKEAWEESKVRLVCDKYAFVINKPLSN